MCAFADVSACCALGRKKEQPPLISVVHDVAGLIFSCLGGTLGYRKSVLLCGPKAKSGASCKCDFFLNSCESGRFLPGRYSPPSVRVSTVTVELPSRTGVLLDARAEPPRRLTVPLGVHVQAWLSSPRFSLFCTSKAKVERPVVSCSLIIVLVLGKKGHG